jgi:16S rRNA processing protein RimM
MTKKAEATYITLGKFGSTYGVHGWLKIHTYTEFDASILDYKPWYISKTVTVVNSSTEWEKIEVEAAQTHGKGIIVKLPNINSPEDARLLTGKLIAIHRDQLPKLKKDEYYWSDLEGLTVINKNGEVLGKVIYLMETGSNDVLVVKNDKEHAIPYLPGDVIICVDLAKQEIHVDWDPI